MPYVYVALDGPSGKMIWVSPIPLPGGATTLGELLAQGYVPFRETPLNPNVVLLVLAKKA